MVGTPPVYEFMMDNALALIPDPVLFADSFEQDVVHAVIVGSIGRMVTVPGVGPEFQADPGNPAQQAVLNGLLKAIGSQPFPASGPGRQQAQIATAAARFAALTATTRHAWLVANLAALKAGTSPWRRSHERRLTSRRVRDPGARRNVVTAGPARVARPGGRRGWPGCTCAAARSRPPSRRWLAAPSSCGRG